MVKEKFESISRKYLKDSNQIIIKSNDLIEARYRLSLQESHVILWLLTQININDEDFKPHKMRIIEFSKMVQVEAGNKYSELRKITKRLMQRIIEIYEPKQEKIIQVAWLSSATYETKKGYVSLEFSPQLKPYLLQLKNRFTKIDIVDTLKLKSIYSVRIFELLLQYVNIGIRKISIEDLRAYCGIEENEYRDYFDLKRKVIQRAKEEISTKTDYKIDYQEIKESRKVISIEWTIKKQTQLEKTQREKASVIQKELSFQNTLLKEIIEYGFSNQTAKKLLQQELEEVVRNALKAVNLQLERGNVKNPKAMLRTAIKENWHPEIFKQQKIFSY